MKHMPQLDGVRAIAAGMVLFCHFAPGYPRIWASGVLLFFVLSGFLITGILLRLRTQIVAGEMSVQAAFCHFYYRRTVRIFPLYFLVVGGGCAIGLFGFREFWPYHLVYLSNLLPGTITGYTSHFWSLCVEEQFYLIWPFIVLLVPERNLKRLCYLLIAFRFLLCRIDPTMGKMLPGSVDALCLGALLAMMHRENSIPHVFRFLAQPLHMTCLFFAMIAFSDTEVNAVDGTFSFPNIGLFHQPELCRISSGLFFMTVIHHASKGVSGFQGTILSNALLRYLGRISYGIYVYHLPVVGVLSLAWPVFAVNTWTLLIVKVLATFAVAIPSYHLFEKPINDLKDRKFRMPAAEAA